MGITFTGQQWKRPISIAAKKSDKERFNGCSIIFSRTNQIIPL